MFLNLVNKIFWEFFGAHPNDDVTGGECGDTAVGEPQAERCWFWWIRLHIVDIPLMQVKLRLLFADKRATCADQSVNAESMTILWNHNTSAMCWQWCVEPQFVFGGRRVPQNTHFKASFVNVWFALVTHFDAMIHKRAMNEGNKKCITYKRTPMEENKDIFNVWNFQL